jgi:hypothetical protein
MTPAADVVTVADFEAGVGPRFEVLTLLFLGAWMQHTGASRAWPLHLACIGDPPSSVRRLADQAGASVTMHPPLLFNALRTSNKLRGFDVRPTTDRLLLLDTDVLVLGDLTPLVASVGRGIGVGVASINYLAEPAWRQVFAAAGVPYPGPVGTCWCADRTIADRRGLDDSARALCLRTPPFFNGGAVLAPMALGALWREHLGRVVQHFRAHAAPWPAGRVPNDEHGLATSVEQMRRAGIPVVTIPPKYHARPLLLRAGVVGWAEIAVFHYHIRLKSFVGTVGELERFLLDQGSQPGRVGADDGEVFAPFYDRLRGIYEQHVRRALSAASPP